MTARFLSARRYESTIMIVSDANLLDHKENGREAMRVSTALALASVSILAAGCSASSNVSEFAGVPAYQLPPDHIRYRPQTTGRPVREAVTTVQETLVILTPQEENARFLAFMEAENGRLAKVTTICRHCEGAPAPLPSYVRSQNIDLAKPNLDTKGDESPSTRSEHASRGQSTR
jgi:hypothetical protein